MPDKNLAANQPAKAGAQAPICHQNLIRHGRTPQTALRKQALDPDHSNELLVACYIPRILVYLKNA